MNGSSHLGVGQDPLLDLVNMRDYRVQYNDSPASIARRFGLAVSSLLAANPQKPTKIVAGMRTFQDLRIGETLSVPSVGVNGAGVGDAASDAVAALTAVDPCDQANVGLVWAAQQAIGLTPDGKWGAGSSRAANAKGLPGPPGCSPRPSWWAPAGQVNRPPTGSGQYTAPQNTIYGNVPTPSPLPLPPAPSAASAALQTLTTLDPCSQANASAVGDAQAAVGLNPDGKWGTQSANAARPILGAATPPACSPRPAWWSPPGQSNYAGRGGASPAVSPAPILSADYPTPQPVSPAPSPTPVGPSPITPTPTKHGISTGMIVAGAVGIAALVGIVAMAVSSKGKTTTRYRTGKTKIKYRLRKRPTRHHKGKKR